MSLTSRASFPGTARLRSPAEFAPALKGRRLARGALFVLSVAPPQAVQVQSVTAESASGSVPTGVAVDGSTGDASAVDASVGAAIARPAAAPEARLGLVIGKRYAPLSVSRSAIKRVIREAFRHKRLALPAGDYVVRLHTRIPSVSLTALKHMTRLEMDGHWLRAARSAQPARPEPRSDRRPADPRAGQPEPRPRAVDNAVTPDKGAERDGTRV